jgi:hypothetical protein
MPVLALKQTIISFKIAKIVLFLFVVALGIAACAGPAGITSPSNNIENSNNSTPQETSANNISMKLISAHTEGSSGYRVELCFDLPTQRDWMLNHSNLHSETTLAVGDVKIYPSEEGTMYWQYDKLGKIIQRCQYLYFKVIIPMETDMASLFIGKLYARGSGQSDYCLEVSQKMAERNSKIEIDCMKMDGFEGLVYVKFPVELLSMDPVYKRIFKDVNWEYYHGPWSFTFPVNPP